MADESNNSDFDYNNIKDKDLDNMESKDFDVISEEDKENPIVRRAEYFLIKEYKKDIDVLMGQYPNQKSLYIDFEKIEAFDPKFADELLDKPDIIIQAFKIAVKQYKSSLITEDTEFDIHVRIYNLPEERRIVIKNLSSEDIGKLIAIEGIVRLFQTVVPKIRMGHWICKKCGNEMDTIQEGSELVKPRACPECRHKDFDLDESSSKFIDYQKMEIQEPLDALRGGEQPNPLRVMITDDLVNNFVAGDKMIFTGILRLQPPQKKGTVYGKYLECIHIEGTKQDYEDVEIDEDDENKIKELSNDPNVYNLIAKSVAPHIYGHDKIKEAIAMQLFGGVRKILKDKSRIRGNIHILLVGDPGTGKSQMLQYTTRVAPKSIYVVGKTASGAGLTATAVKEESGENSGWTLKAGALVLANGGFAMVDEFDKMSSEDRSSMHEAMEQETVSIAKAGLVTSFKTETSVLAAANPKYGRFDSYKNLAEQIEIPPTLMSRFDLFFIVRDVLDEKRDRDTVMSILETHRAGELLKRDEVDVSSEKEEVKSEIDAEFLRKYISYARTRIFPVMSETAMKRLQKFFIELRKMSQDGRVTVTYRQLEALIRLSEASARVRLSDKISIDDAERAINLFKSSMEQVGIDPETGAFDIDIITTGQSHSQVNKIRRILEIIESITKDKKTATFDEIVETAEKEGIEKGKVRDIVDKLSRSGDIYEPRPFNYAIPKKG